jgi:lactoylglutathione lyase
MKYLHTMVRVTDLDRSLAFYCEALGLKQIKRNDYENGRFSLIFVAADENPESQI